MRDRRVYRLLDSAAVGGVDVQSRPGSAGRPAHLRFRTLTLPHSTRGRLRPSRPLAARIAVQAMPAYTGPKRPFDGMRREKMGASGIRSRGSR